LLLSLNVLFSHVLTHFCHGHPLPA
jgi:hypothetical protein